MSDADDVDLGTVSTNRLTVHDAAHLPGIIGDGEWLQAGTIRLDTAEGWVEITAADGGVVVERIDVPEGSDG